MPPIPVGGLATGLDTETLIAKLLSVEQRPINVLQTQKLKYQAQSTAYQDLNTKLLGLKFKSETLKEAGTFFPRSVTSSTETVATATATPGTARGTFTLTASALAKGSIAAAGTTKTATTDIIASAAGSFEFKLGASGTVKSVAVTATTTLGDLVTAINALNAGVKASAVNTGTAASPAYKLTITSNATGSANNIVIVTDPTTISITNTQTATDAAFTITGFGSFTRSTNTFSDAIDGVTITLKAASGSTDLALDYDKSGLQTRVQNFVDAYNDVVKGIDAQTAVTKLNDGSTSSGAFTGDVTTRQLRTSLRTLLATRVKSTYPTLADVGITTQKDGTLVLDSAKFQKAATDNAQAVSDLFAGPSSDTATGIGDLFYAAADTATKTLTGTIAVRKDGITQTIKRFQASIDAALLRLQARETRLREQFASLEQVTAKLQNTQSFLTAQLKQLQNLSSSNSDQ